MKRLPFHKQSNFFLVRKKFDQIESVVQKTLSLFDKRVKNTPSCVPNKELMDFLKGLLKQSQSEITET
jgi:hypothetical protein